MPIWLSLILVVLFLLMNAFFVIAEFSLVRVRKSQIEILVEEGKKGAKRAFEMADNVNEYLSGLPAWYYAGFAGVGLAGRAPRLPRCFTRSSRSLACPTQLSPLFRWVLATSS